MKSLIPAYILNKDGSRGIMGRACTYDYKITKIEQTSRHLAGITRGQKTIGVIQWIGISADEASRMKPPKQPWIQHRWPLIDMGISRRKCLQWMKDNGFPEPPRSACIFCPFHSDREWLRIKTDSPSEFKQVVEFEKELQRVKALTDNQSGKPFLHNSLVPISEVDFRSKDEKRGQLNMFENECEGMCGV